MSNVQGSVLHIKDEVYWMNPIGYDLKTMVLSKLPLFSCCYKWSPTVIYTNADASKGVEFKTVTTANNFCCGLCFPLGCCGVQNYQAYKLSDFKPGSGFQEKTLVAQTFSPDAPGWWHCLCTPQYIWLCEYNCWKSCIIMFWTVGSCGLLEEVANKIGDCFDAFLAPCLVSPAYCYLHCLKGESIELGLQNEKKEIMYSVQNDHNCPCKFCCGKLSPPSDNDSMPICAGQGPNCQAFLAGNVWRQVHRNMYDGKQKTDPERAVLAQITRTAPLRPAKPDACCSCVAQGQELYPAPLGAMRVDYPSAEALKTATEDDIIAQALFFIAANTKYMILDGCLGTERRTIGISSGSGGDPKLGTSVSYLDMKGGLIETLDTGDLVPKLKDLAMKAKGALEKEL